MTGNEAQRLRHKAKKKSKEVAKELGISRSQYARFEAGLIGLDERLTEKLQGIFQAAQAAKAD